MQLFLDISVVALILVTVIVCWVKGFIRSALGVAKAVLSVILTFTIAPHVAGWIRDTIIGDRIANYIYSRFVAMFEQGAATFDLSHVVANLPTWLRTLLGASDAAALGSDFTHMTNATASQLWSMAETFAGPIENMISRFIGYAVTFLVVMLVLSIAAFFLSKLADLPVLRTCDRLLGLLLGILSAVLYSATYTVLLFAIFSLIEGSYAGFEFHAAFEGTVVFQWIYNHNLFRLIFGIG